jgi:hypothetical protein
MVAAIAYAVRGGQVARRFRPLSASGARIPGTLRQPDRRSTRVYNPACNGRCRCRLRSASEAFTALVMHALKGIHAGAPIQADLRRWLDEVLAEEKDRARITDA